MQSNLARVLIITVALVAHLEFFGLLKKQLRRTLRQVDNHVLADTVLRGLMDIFLAQDSQKRCGIDNSLLQTQAQLRAGVDPSMFLTSYADVSASFSTGGTAKYVQGTNNAALFTLAGNGIASGVVTLGSCSLFSPHSHARKEKKKRRRERKGKKCHVGGAVHVASMYENVGINWRQNRSSGSFKMCYSLPATTRDKLG